MKKKLVLNFPPKIVTKPITYHLVKDYDLVTNILYAKIEQGETGVLVLEIKGPRENFEKGLEFLKEQGVEVQLLAEDILLDRETCVDCGLCTGVCPTNALYLKEDFTLGFDKEKCVLCENCIATCPTKAITLKF